MLLVKTSGQNFCVSSLNVGERLSAPPFVTVRHNSGRGYVYFFMLSRCKNKIYLEFPFFGAAHLPDC